MKIRKVKSIKNIGSFVDYQSDSQLDSFHDKRNIVYGMNWCGKTTLSELLRSISEWKYTLDIVSKLWSSPWFCIETDSNDIKSLSPNHSNIKIFNKHFVEENVFCKDWAVPILHLGKENDELQKEHDKLIEENKSLNDQKIKVKQELDTIIFIKDNICQEKAKVIKTIIWWNYNKSNIENCFDGWVFTKVTKSEDELHQLKITINNSQKAILNQRRIDVTNIKKQYADCDIILKKNIINKIIQWLNNQIEPWLKAWLDIHKGKETCEFCKSTISKERLIELEGHFNDEYDRIIKDIDLLISSFPELSIPLDESANFYEDLSDRYIQEKQKVEQELVKYRERKIIIIEELNNKKTRMNESLNLSNKLFDFTQIESSITEINALITIHNQRTHDFDESINKSKKQIELHYVSEIYDKYFEHKGKTKELNEKIENFISKINDNRTKINEITKKINPQAIALNPINALIQRILGRDDISLIPNSYWYQIVRDTNKPFNPSEWEKTVIWLAYFINKLIDQKTDTTDIVVFDDPVTSLDEQIFYNIYGLISSLEWYQIFVLTHHFQFLRLFIDQLWLPSWNKGTYFRIRARHIWRERKSDIVNLEKQIYKYHSEYEFLFKSIYDFVEAKRSNPHDVIDIDEWYNNANMTRKIIEIFGSIYFPKDNLSEKLKRCLVKADMWSDHNEIYRFINSFSHNNSLQTISLFDTTIYTTNVRSVLDKVMKMIQEINPEHYTEMINI